MRVAVIGAGAIARRGHLPALKKHPDVEVVAIADLNEVVAKEVAKEFDVPNYYTDYREMLLKENIDTVHVCTPTPTHYKIVADVIKSGFHALVEKPLAMKLKEVINLKDLAKDHDVVVGVVYNWRYFSSVIQALKRVRGGYIGRLLSLHGIGFTHFPIEWTRSTWLYHKGGVLYDFFPHLVDLLLLFAEGKPVKVIAHGGDYLPSAGFINHASITIYLENGTIITAHTSWLMGTFMFYLFLHGTGGHIFLDVRYDTYEEIHGLPNPIDNVVTFSKNMLRVAKAVLNKSLFIGTLGNYLYLISDFIRSIKKRRKTGLFCSIDDEVRRSFVIEGALQSIERGGVPISLNDSEK